MSWDLLVANHVRAHADVWFYLYEVYLCNEVWLFVFTIILSIVPFLKLPFTFGLMMKLLKIFSDTDSIPDLECEVCDEQTINMLLHRFNINGIL